MGINITSFSSSSKIICTRWIKSCFNTPTFAQDHQGVYPVGEFLQWEFGPFSNFVLGGSLWGLMGFVLQLHPQGHREEKERSGEKISWMTLDLPLLQGSLEADLENVFDVSFLQQFPEAEMNWSLRFYLFSACWIILYKYYMEILHTLARRNWNY